MRDVRGKDAKVDVVVELTAAEQVAHEMVEQQAFEQAMCEWRSREVKPDDAGFDQGDIPERVKSMIRWPLRRTTTYGDIVEFFEAHAADKVR